MSVYGYLSFFSQCAVGCMVSINLSPPPSSLSGYTNGLGSYPGAGYGGYPGAGRGESLVMFIVLPTHISVSNYITPELSNNEVV